MLRNFNGTLDKTYLPILDDRGTLMGVADENGVLIEKLYYNSTGLIKSYDANCGDWGQTSVLMFLSIFFIAFLIPKVG